MTQEQKQQLFEVARKRLSQYQKMNEAQKSSVRPRGGIEIDYGVSIALMEIALAALTAQPVKLPAFPHSTQEIDLALGYRDRDWIEAIRAAGYEVQE
ncbi:hypothetical protein IFU23_05915 [Pantoea agglomerans]|uniref:Uncharacterized protein n=1 Tax=Enterobacter agglomerans TaxID=549 RepID=A0ACC5PW26_ENTAG|nr:hypothetical protein [Pantoea agglomerans]MBD8129305.1 hypothetical protein [Pantoea agglomerans]MBD8152302.1 hypothetical protein [Pantoea agglomerans]MBD8157642.1 hypothetical protein [Pantoea agglomerans]MBD8231481.1 hypothetical protein [Pantoea agglomerans]MBD8241826.1 hypothetical protein [Pantoea agglomerans]